MELDTEEHGDHVGQGGGSRGWARIGDGTGPRELVDFGAELEIFCDSRSIALSTWCSCGGEGHGEDDGHRLACARACTVSVQLASRPGETG
ncbi:hypothetical protein E2562_004971 [Oryza meyeriana var. granulata]|uniref:Uncharacterized protein n=1 Tax=Oryza meyeriana var. granulata TaxID=110450 RepID=A0A6G1C491_9ORYZ|nr:hypothetical protein E2562_004971 [Oryza meyeriana var. granulata]